MRLVIPTYLMVLVALVALQACANESPSHLGQSCMDLAARSQINETCAIEIAKAEIVKHQGKMEYPEFSARLDSVENLWVVMAIYEPTKPGGMCMS